MAPLISRVNGMGMTVYARIRQKALEVPDMSQPAPFPVNDASRHSLMDIHGIAKIDAWLRILVITGVSA